MCIFNQVVIYGDIISLFQKRESVVPIECPTFWCDHNTLLGTIGFECLLNVEFVMMVAKHCIVLLRITTSRHGDFYMRDRTTVQSGLIINLIGSIRLSKPIMICCQ